MDFIASDLTPSDRALVVWYLSTYYKVLGLDMDGTAARNEPVHFKVARNLLLDGLSADADAYARAENNVTWQWWLDNLGSGQGGIWEKFKAQYPTFDMPKDKFVSDWGKGYSDGVAEIAQIAAKPAEERSVSETEGLKSFVREGLHELMDIFNEAGGAVVFYSVSTEHMLNANLKALGVEDKVAAAVSGTDIENGNHQFKPAPDGWELALNRLKEVRPDLADVTSDDVLGFEDTAKGVNGLRNFGARGIMHIYLDGKSPDPLATYTHCDTCGNVLLAFLAAARAKSAASKWGRTSRVSTRSYPASVFRAGIK
jgi:beta-phosphoglucomutase-like phosphatase (HAD superfamily)